MAPKIKCWPVCSEWKSILPNTSKALKCTHLLSASMDIEPQSYRSSAPLKHPSSQDVLIFPPSRPALPRLAARLNPTPDDILMSRRERHRDLTQFSRRRRTVLMKVDELHRDCHADVYLVVRREGKIYTYTSSDAVDWPPSEEELVSQSNNTGFCPTHIS